MSAPAARTLAEIGKDMRRQARSFRTVILDTDEAMALLAVAEAAVEWEAADAEQRRVPAWSRDTDLFERMLFRYQSATRALRAAVRGEGVLND